MDGTSTSTSTPTSSPNNPAYDGLTSNTITLIVASPFLLTFLIVAIVVTFRRAQLRRRAGRRGRAFSVLDGEMVGDEKEREGRERERVEILERARMEEERRGEEEVRRPERARVGSELGSVCGGWDDVVRGGSGVRGGRKKPWSVLVG